MKGVAGPVLTDFFGSRMLRKLAVLPELRPSSDAEAWSGLPCLGAVLWEKVFKGNCTRWAGTHAEKVLFAVYNCGDAQVKKEAAAELKKVVMPETVEQWAGKFAFSKKQAGQQGSKECKTPATKAQTPAAKTPAKQTPATKAQTPAAKTPAQHTPATKAQTPAAKTLDKAGGETARKRSAAATAEEGMPKKSPRQTRSRAKAAQTPAK
ncbi:hypothetical protein CYMTET_56782 [Cymbomonas tetramitiformis]|uniref:Uncharacterized protein n=1 Tax=Cymbomonas tetramitiformis TaxID=36881 RepID=A0AAE0BBE5_9CHLO|nr:hypothetical protein CYMTET_56782 [Cymbomonas tetramitiformis]